MLKFIRKIFDKYGKQHKDVLTFPTLEAARLMAFDLYTHNPEALYFEQYEDKEGAIKYQVSDAHGVTILQLIFITE